MGLSRDADPYTVDEVYNAYPALAGGERVLLKMHIEVPMSWMRQDVLAEVARSEATCVGGKCTFRTWLTAYEKKLDEWLARLRR